ncbi:MAG TPA: hypothetical protein VJK03_04965 [Candidatus Nanoarchaeia archaeon]|nr:hypothetical protein [Candidatus Nanoarchaeia archaeon]
MSTNEARDTSMKDHLHLASVEALSHIKNQLQEMSEKEAQKKHLPLLGQPWGASLEHCIFLGLKYCEDFEKKVRYYGIRRNLDPSDYRYQLSRVPLPHPLVAIDFYGERK